MLHWDKLLTLYFSVKFHKTMCYNTQTLVTRLLQKMHIFLILVKQLIKILYYQLI